MSEDWLMTSSRPLAVEDMIMSLRAWADQVSVRRDRARMCTVVVDRFDRVLLWLGPSQHVCGPAEALGRSGLSMVTDADRAAMWWTEVIQPAAGDSRLESTVDAASMAIALARAVSGSAQRWSATSAESGADKGPSERADDIACDVLTDTCAIFVQTRAVLAVTPWVSIAMSWATARGLTPVFLTPGPTQLSPAMHHFARRGGCLWVRKGDEGMHNGATGAALAWSRGAFVDASAAPWPVALRGGWEVVYEGEALHTDPAGMQIGQLAKGTFDACGIEAPTSWGVLEPTSEEWALEAITDHARTASPEPSRMFFRSPNGDGIITVLPQPVGVQESVAWAAPAEDLMPRSTDLGRLGERFLNAGSDVALLGYRRPTITRSGPGGATGTVLPGVICFKPGRFGGLDANTLDLPAGSGARAYACASGIVVTFPVSAQNSDVSSAGLLAAWDHTLAVLAHRNSVHVAYQARTKSVTVAPERDVPRVGEGA